MRQRAVWLAAALVLAGAPAAPAQVVVYDNTTNFTPPIPILLNGGATLQGGNTITTLVADDITPAAGSAGQSVSSFGFIVVNNNSTAVTVRPLARFYGSDGTGGGPGTLLGAFTFAPITFTAASATQITFPAITPGQFVLPAGVFWAGLTFDDNNGTTGATAAQLNNFGEAFFNPPTVGSSQDLIFETSSAGSFASSNPAGTTGNFGGSPVANLGWQFTVTPVPEPGSLALGGAAAGLALLRRRRRSR
jgi:hypothetical protein